MVDHQQALASIGHVCPICHGDLMKSGGGRFMVNALYRFHELFIQTLAPNGDLRFDDEQMTVSSSESAPSGCICCKHARWGMQDQ